MVARGTPEPAIALIDAALARYAGELVLLRAVPELVMIDARRTDEAIRESLTKSERS